jgi:DNA repair protein RecN (Recombination protein N)
MLSILKIQNLVLVDSLEMELSAGMNVITGETGAGKSILLKGLGLIAGMRGGAELIREGADKCEVEGLFVLSEDRRAALLEECPWTEVILADEELLIHRIVERTGRGKIYLNGRLSTRGELENIAAHLLDITGQREQQTLLDPSKHIALLDEHGVGEDLRTKVSSAFRKYSDAERALTAFRSANNEKKEYLRRISFEHEELSQLGIQPGEKERLHDEQKRLSGYEQLTSVVSEGLALISDEEDGIERKLRRLSAGIERALKTDPTLRSGLDLIAGSLVQLREGRAFLEEYAAKLEPDPSRTEWVRERVSDIAKAERKYGKSAEDLVNYAKAVAAEIEAATGGERGEEGLENDLKTARAELSILEQEIRSERKKAAAKLKREVEKSLREVNMKHAVFESDFSEVASNSRGADAVQFLLAANPGDSPKALNKVASGGELSRILLILKTLLNEKREPSLQVFDEIDAGIGGAVAQVVGEKIRRLTPRCQVLLVTHSPQIAALADCHFLIEKNLSGARMKTNVQRLGEDERVGEVARMLAGKRVTGEFEQSARELMKARGR